VTVARARRAFILFPFMLMVVAFLRLASTVQGATSAREPRAWPGSGSPAAAPASPVSLQIEEAADLLVGGRSAHRTLILRGLRAWSGELDLDWEARLSGQVTGRGRHPVSARLGNTSRLVLSIPVPDVDVPAGMDLRVGVTDAGLPAGDATFRFTVYPSEPGRHILDLLEKSRVALYDPEKRASPALQGIGLRWEEVGSPSGLALYAGDLIIVGPGGFSRGHEDLGPILAARARSGMRILILEQPTLPGTLSEDLRLWPSFSRSSDLRVLSAPDHPILRGLAPGEGTGYLGAVPAGLRPLLPPTRGNFRVLAEVRARIGTSWQEGVTLLEFAIGPGTVLVAQSSLCADYQRDPRARILLANTLAYLLGDRLKLKRSFLYGDTGDLPSCLARLSPHLEDIRTDLQDVEVLLLPGDWQAPRLASSARLPRPAEVARYLKEGGTVILLNPQPLVAGYLERVIGTSVHFEALAPSMDLPESARSSPLLQGIDPDDLALLGRSGRPEIRLRPAPGPDGVEALLLAPGLARYRVGRGALIALTLPEPADCATSRTSSLMARLLTNLGVPLEHPPGIETQTITFLD
jgi:hypothetical protein